MARKKGINKLKTGFSIDRETNELFEAYCHDRSINKSKLVDKILKEFLNVELSKEKNTISDVEIR